MKECIKFVGMDVHRDSISVAVADSEGGQTRFVGEIASTPQAVRDLVNRLGGDGSRLSLCYEAGPSGYALYRMLSERGEECAIVVPVLTRKSTGHILSDFLTH